MCHKNLWICLRRKKWYLNHVSDIKSQWTLSKRKWSLSGMPLLCKFNQSKRLFSLQRKLIKSYCNYKSFVLNNEKEKFLRKIMGCSERTPQRRQQMIEYVICFLVICSVPVEVRDRQDCVNKGQGFKEHPHIWGSPKWNLFSVICYLIYVICYLSA